jgi:hypothetical protein
MNDERRVIYFIRKDMPAPKRDRAGLDLFKYIEQRVRASANQSANAAIGG